ncbi:hypothetical protein [Finegoldia sp. BIOML-A1]|uniref:hypothetical protein n=1 Tax=Finegoldia sp. BIOML-A1 TaxID=2584649 RepID=UPI0012B05514|nr:hypothetical protein [Finegoldia sp. BIOML-A1]MSB10423.1 hypothetical protein [Finegoldia sp. BIOML-A1]
MKSKIDWKRSEETLKAIIMDIVNRKEEYEKESNSEFDEGVIAGYEFVLDSIKSELEVRGYDFNEWIKDKN